MVVYVGTLFTAGSLGKRTVPVQCEKCRTAFHYQLTRMGVGKGSAPYNLGQAGAAKRTAAAAERNLAKRLERDCELVPCPKCNWVNEELVTRFRQRKYRRAWILILVLMVGGSLLAASVTLALEDLFRNRREMIHQGMFVGLALFLLAPVYILAIRAKLRGKIDPNATFPRPPVLPPGTPPALMEQRDDETGESFLVPVDRGGEQPGAAPIYAIYREGQLTLPDVCCVCMAPATTMHRSPMETTENSELRVPTCRRCHRIAQWRWGLVLLLSIVIAAAIGGLLAYTLPRIDEIVRWFVFGITTFFGGIVGGVVIAGKVCSPYRLQSVDSDRGICKFAASNPAYTALVAEQARQADGFAGEEKADASN